MDDKCTRCGGILLPQNDYIYSIDYYMCLQCGNVIFLDDGLGILRYRLPKNKKEEE
jgi:hypothetical protein